MTLENFTTLIKENIEETLEEKESCKINHVLKNNGTQLVGISILHQDVNISPTIYLNNFYDSYENGDISMEEILNEILCSLGTYPSRPQKRKTVQTNKFVRSR